MIRVALPAPLRTLAGIAGEVELAVDHPATLAALLDALEARHPSLRGTIRDPVTRRRRAFVRVFAGGEDLSHLPLEAPLPPAVAAGAEPLVILGAMAGGGAPPHDGAVLRDPAFRDVAAIGDAEGAAAPGEVPEAWAAARS